MAEQKNGKSYKLFSPDFLTPQERQDRIVEILAHGVLRLIEKNKPRTKPSAISEDSLVDKDRKIPEENP